MYIEKEEKTDGIISKIYKLSSSKNIREHFKKTLNLERSFSLFYYFIWSFKIEYDMLTDYKYHEFITLEDAIPYYSRLLNAVFYFRESNQKIMRIEFLPEETKKQFADYIYLRLTTQKIKHEPWCNNEVIMLTKTALSYCDKFGYLRSRDLASLLDTSQWITFDEKYLNYVSPMFKYYFHKRKQHIIIYDNTKDLIIGIKNLHENKKMEILNKEVFGEKLLSTQQPSNIVFSSETIIITNEYVLFYENFGLEDFKNLIKSNISQL